MNIPVTIRKHLTRHGGQFKARKLSGGDDVVRAAEQGKVPLEKLARAVVLRDGGVRLMAVFPASHRLELELLNRRTKRNFTLCATDELEQIFEECHLGALPPLGEAYGIKVILDKALEALDEVYFAVGRTDLLLRATQEEFLRLQQKALRGHAVARALDEVPTAQAEGADAQMKRKVESVKELPPMPGIATEILALRNNPYAHVSELAAIVERDPGLAAQVIRYASSPFYGYQGKVESVAMAIARVLGMDFVMDLAFGLSLGKSFRNPTEGPLGLNAFWQHATYTAALSQKLCNSIDYMKRPSPGVAYLAGLLHNFGFLLLGHLFPEQFARLNKAVAEQPERPVTELEREVLGLSHTDLGLWLMEAWEMPKDIVEAVREHHNPDFRSDYSVYANLVYVANCLLARHGIGDADSVELPEALLEELGLDVERAEVALSEVMQGRESLDFIANKMAA